MNQEFELYTPAAVSKKTTGSNYPVIKIISVVLGILSAALFVYYAADYTSQYFAQIEQYKQMGMEIPASTLYTIYFQIALTYVVGILPLIGAVLPLKYSKCSILLISSSICWGVVNTLPSIIISIIQGAAFADILMLLVMFVAGTLALAAAILLIAAPEYEDIECADELSYIPEDLEDEDYGEEIIIEEAEDASEDAFEAAEEEIPEEPAEEPVEEPAEEPVEEAVEEAIEEPVEEAAEEIAEEAAEAEETEEN